MKIFTKFHKDWTIFVDFLLVTNFWRCAVFSCSDFRIILFFNSLYKLILECPRPKITLVFLSLVATLADLLPRLRGFHPFSRRNLSMSSYISFSVSLAYFSSPFSLIFPVGLRKSPMNTLVLKLKCSRWSFLMPFFSMYCNHNGKKLRKSVSKMWRRHRWSFQKAL